MGGIGWSWLLRINWGHDVVVPFSFIGLLLYNFILVIFIYF